MADVDDFRRLALDDGRAQHAGGFAHHLDMECVLDDVDNLVDNEPHGAALVGEHQERLHAFGAYCGTCIYGHQRHQVAAILHHVATTGHFDFRGVHLLEPRHQ